MSQSPYLRTSRLFPTEDKDSLRVELEKMYIDIANRVNSRIISNFPSDTSIVTGERWFLTDQRQGALRRVYSFTGTGNIAHGIPNFSSISFVRCFGGFTDGTNWYGALYAPTIAGAITFYIDSANIVIQSGAGAPTITSGYLVLEWVV